MMQAGSTRICRSRLPIECNQIRGVICRQLGSCDTAILAYREDSPENRTFVRSCPMGAYREGDLVQSRAGNQ
jgi:hypothetical protein